MGDKAALHVIRSDGSGHRVLIDSVADFGVYQWSRDGSLILTVITAPDGTNTIALVAAADGAVRAVHTLGTEFPELMTLSPDARYVAYDYPQAGASRDRDIFILDTHTGTHWPLAAAPGHDSSPWWSPDGRAIVFFSDRNRALSAWMVPMENGRPQAEPRIVKDDVGRVWPRGFTRDGALHYHLWTGFYRMLPAAVRSEASISLTSGSQRSMWSLDSRTAMALWKNGRITVRDVVTGTTREWAD